MSSANTQAVGNFTATLTLDGKPLLLEMGNEKVEIYHTKTLSRTKVNLKVKASTDVKITGPHQLEKYNTLLQENEKLKDIITELTKEKHAHMVSEFK